MVLFLKGFFGAGEEIRTPDQRLGKPLSWGSVNPLK